MTANELVVVAALVAFVLWVVAGIIDALAARRPLPRVTQRRRTPPLPPCRRPDLSQAREVRAARARHRAVEGGGE